ncbi:hypothetical protein Rhe02_75480 [Rhizocola hellebori]|uniref:DUF1697 domain-containing protein n=1 Tax=Rhizocola hellebori TaxID=1392758 RepID=A0A8J3QEX4_9ACTN|nr:DUF1697 domain-containing protein [Rhizocola hellebori]GIH09481.1 hypothetical protein Rhe02_75480 [Rhizocola hellebori]
MRTAVFLRGINVGGNAKISMVQLREAMQRHGHADVKTLLQSGNVVVDKITPAAMEKLLLDEFGMQIRVMTRSNAQLRKVIEANPFPEHEQEPAKLGVAFLDKAPGKVQIDLQRYAPDEFIIAGKEIYLWFPNGMGRSKIGDRTFQKSLGAEMTVRNWNTVTKMAELTG